MAVLTTTAVLLFALLSNASASPLSSLSPRAASNIATVTLTNNTGTPNHLASGVIFGIPLNPSQIPDNLYTEWGFNFARGGGAQLPSPRSGYINGIAEYNGRFQETLENYQVAQKYGAKYICPFEALFGQWNVDNGPYPGDNGNWTQWDAMTQQVISDMKSNKVNLSSWIIEIFNESDNTGYWKRSEAQALEMWRRTYVAFRNAFGSSVTIQGPSAAQEPSLSSSWWTNFTSYVKTNNVIPDTWTWHMESGGGNMLESTANFHALLDKYSLPYNNININEYAVQSEQVPTGGAWWISQLERVNIPGLRGNWQNYPGLYDYLANLISKPNAPNASPTATGYYPVGEFQVYKYYNQNMTGHRLGTSPSGDMIVDVYATQDTSTRTVKVLAGNRQKKGTWEIQVSPVTSLGLPASGSVMVQCRQFNNNGTWGMVSEVGNCGVFKNNYTGNVIDLTLYQTDTQTAYAFEFSY